MYQNLRGFAISLIIVLALAAAFTAGRLFDDRLLLPVTGLSNPSNGAVVDPTPGPLNPDLIEEAYRTIQENYADRETLSETDLTYGAITGMVDSLGDTGHSRFMTPEMLKSHQEATQGSFEGIGALLNVNDAGNPVILAPMDNSPAMKAGLRPGDIILEVDGVDVSKAQLSEVVRRVVGPAGTDVTLTLQNPETAEVRDVTITRARIVVKNVTWQMLPGTKVAHVRIAAFSQQVSNDLVKALNEAKRQGAEGILLDLRNNPGGLLHESIQVVSQFLSSGNALQVKDSDGNVRSLPVRRGGVATDIPIVVLINEGSASASEITAGALQDYERATLVGQTTFGTGTVLNQFNLSDGSALLLATELWLTPKGREIWHQGIAPDVEVELPSTADISIPETERNLTAEELKQLDDAQLLRGLEILQEQIK